MQENLFKHINRFVKITEKDFDEILTFFNLRTLHRKETIASANTKCNFNHFVVNGCIHMFFVTNKGTERTVQFAIENWWLTDFLAY